MTNDKVTLRDVYGAINDLRREMGGRFERVEARVDILEDFKGRVIGIMAVLVIGFQLIGNWIWKKVVGD